ncbi:MAG: glutamate--tRNA ligase, partial [Pseudomonadota bacterium]
MTVTRFAPSPTGYLHVGNLRAALFNWLIARQAGGTFILRIDDTDPERSEEAYVDAIREDLEWLGLTWDREERQSARLDRYGEVADRLRDDGRLYEAFETPVELDLKRKKQLNMGKPPVYDRSALGLSDAEKDALRAERGGHWRFKLDHARIEWQDAILGEISIDAASVSDPVLIRGDGQMLYTMASVVDDTDMGITHVVRGADHVTNTATQIQMIGALGHTPPVFAHHSLLTGPQGEALSKRLGTLALRDLRAAGIEPMAVLSLMARLGSSQPVELTEDLDALVAGFDLGTFGAAPTKFDVDDLKPMTARLLHGRPYAAVAGDLAAMGVDWPDAEAFWDMARENVETLGDVPALRDLCLNGAVPLVDAADRAFVEEAFAMMPEGPWDGATWMAWANAVKDKTGRKGKAL